MGSVKPRDFHTQIDTQNLLFPRGTWDSANFLGQRRTDYKLERGPQKKLEGKREG